MSRRPLAWAGAAFAASLATTGARADDGAPEATEQQEVAPRIRDNLFLLEEAYNQEPGVCQHIQLVRVTPETGHFTYGLTDEWPVPDDRHQVSLGLTVVGDEEGAALGDLALNYRVQALGIGGEGPLAIAPRLTFIMPTGDVDAAASRGNVAFQVNLPLSAELGEYVVVHANAGATVAPAARSASDHRATLVGASVGMAWVVQPLPWLNGLVEGLYENASDWRADGTVGRTATATVSPGLRFAATFDIGLQIVPGVAVPIAFDPDGHTLSVLGYLSIEHKVWDPPAEPVAPADGPR